MRVNLSIWDKLSRVVVCLLAAAAVMAVAVWYFPLIKTNERLRQEIYALKKEVRQQEELSRQLQGVIKGAKTDPRAVERHARERLGYARPGETVIRFETPAGLPAR